MHKPFTAFLVTLRDGIIPISCHSHRYAVSACYFDFTCLARGAAPPRKLTCMAPRRHRAVRQPAHAAGGMQLYTVGPGYYRVRSGDTLRQNARAHDTSVAERWEEGRGGKE